MYAYLLQKMWLSFSIILYAKNNAVHKTMLFMNKIINESDFNECIECKDDHLIMIANIL